MLSEGNLLEGVKLVLAHLASGVGSFLPNFLAAIIVLAATWALANYAWRTEAQSLRRRHHRPAPVALMLVLAFSLIWFGGLVTTADVAFLQMSTTNIVVGLGGGLVVAALAFKNILENCLAGLLILLRRQIQVGDDILFQRMEGHVEQITVSNTYLRRRSGELAILPNALIDRHPPTVLTHKSLRKITLKVRVASGTDLDKACSVLRDALEGLRTIDKSMQPEVICESFSNPSSNLELRWWTEPTVEELLSRDEVARAVELRLDAAGMPLVPAALP